MYITLSNEQRRYLGLAPIKDSWECVYFDGDQYRPKSLLYYEKNIIKRHIISNQNEYKEFQYSDETRDRKFLLPKTKKGKEKKLTPSILESRQPQGVYFVWSKTTVKIASYATQTTFHSENHQDDNLVKWLSNYITDSSKEDLREIQEFAIAKRKHFKYTEGDFFSFKLSRRVYGFGRVLADISKLRIKTELPKNHGLFNLMGKPVLVKIYRYKSDSLNVNLDELKAYQTFPSEYVLDNHLYYGQYPILGNQDLIESDIDFPLSYGQSIQSGSQNVFLQWGIIHKELSMKKFSKYIHGDNKLVPLDSPSRRIIGPYRKDSIGFNLCVNLKIMDSCINSGTFDSYWIEHRYKRDFDLRNPKNNSVKEEILKAFGLDSSVNYLDNLNRKPKSGLKGWLRME